MKILKLQTMKLQRWLLVIKAFTIILVLFGIWILFKINSEEIQIAQQAKDIAAQNQVIAKTNHKNVDCISNLFADYTRNQVPITKQMLNSCNIN